MRLSNQLALNGAGEAQLPAQEHRSPAGPLLAEVLWRRRWSLVVPVCVALLSAAAYLYCAAPIYRSSARLVIDPAAAIVHGEPDRGVLASDNYVQTQVDALRSTPVFARALNSLDHKQLKTFAHVRGDAVGWLRKGSALTVEPVKRADTLVVSMEATDPNEATQIVTAVVDAYLVEQSEQRQRRGKQMVQALEQEKAAIDAKSEKCRQQMEEHQRRHGIVVFQDSKANDILERTAALTASVTTAHLTTVELKARKQAVEKAVQHPESRAAFVSTELMKGRDGGDREYDEMRTLLVQSEIVLSISKTTQSAGNRGIVALEARIQNLREQIAQKEKRLAEAYVLELTTKIAAAEAQLSELQTALVAQQKQAMELGVRSAAHETYAAELAELRKRGAALADRITQVSVNSTKEGPLPVRVTEPATVEPDPVKPQKKLVLLGALLVGGIAGIGLATLRERKDQRIRGPEEAVGLTAAPLLAIVPRIPRALSMSERGQLLRVDGRTPAAEAYRSLRTALRLGAAGNAKTVLVTSATSGDGKSTTASNLAIAMAQAGERTLLIDCDLRKPVQHRIFNLDDSPGIAGVLADEAKLGEAIRTVDTPNLYVLPCGAPPADPSEQLGSKRFASVMQRVTATFDRVIIDAPPVITVTDAQMLAASADLTLVVLRVNQTTRHLVRHCRDLLDRVGARVFGAVANDVPGALADRYYGGSWPYGTPAARTRAPALLPQPTMTYGVVAAEAAAGPPTTDIDAIDLASEEEVR